MLNEDGERICLSTGGGGTGLSGTGLGGFLHYPATSSLAGSLHAGRPLRTYGSCGSGSRGLAAATARRQHVRIVRHRVERGDTLQGIALRYGVTMEEIKRENRLWTTDSLFLRQFLDIPVPLTATSVGGAFRDGHDKSICGSSGSNDSDLGMAGNGRADATADACDGAIRSSKSSSSALPEHTSPQRRTVSLDAVSAATSRSSTQDDSGDKSGEAEENIWQFLGRIDTSIRKTKSQIKELNQVSESGNGCRSDRNDADSGTLTYENGQPNSLPGLTLNAARNATSIQSCEFNGHYHRSPKGANQSLVDSADGLSESRRRSLKGGCYETTFGVDFAPSKGSASSASIVVSSGRKVRTSLQRHRREHEQMFEL